MEQKKTYSAHIWLALLASLTLGLAPFSPEPHVWGKLRWMLGGAKGMKLMDWLDLLMHGAPWLYLFGALGAQVITLLQSRLSER